MERHIDGKSLIRAATYAIAAAVIAKGACELYQDNLRRMQSSEAIWRNEVTIPLKIGDDWIVDQKWLQDNCDQTGNLIGSSYPTGDQETARNICKFLAPKYLTP